MWDCKRSWLRGLLLREGTSAESTEVRYTTLNG